jgi:hypothetical protein
MKKILSITLCFIFIVLFTSGCSLNKPKDSTSDNTLPKTQLSTYNDDRYGFTISYPMTIIPQKSFEKYYFLSDNWIAGNPQDVSGSPVLSIPVYRVTNEKTFPRYWDVEVRIGINTNQIYLKTFLTKSYSASQPLRTESINGITFSVFPIEDAGMMQFVSGYSYRTIHNNIGYAIELIKTGSNYRDTADPNDIAETVLESYFKQTTDILNTFKFTDN